MSSFLDSYNLSILALPAYYLLSIVPHAYAITLGSGGDVSKFDNANPRSLSQKDRFKQSLSPELYARYERAEAAHHNSFESMPLFVAATLAGNMAGLKREGWDGMDGFAGAFLAVRALYAALYVNHTTQGASYVRSSLWAAGMALCVRVLVKSAKAMSGKVLL